MRIGLLSDTHNDNARLGSALRRFRQEGVTTLLHAGDLTAPSVLHLMRDFDLWLARGNMDRDPRLAGEVRELFGPDRLAYTHSLKLNGSRVALVHGDSWEQLERLIRSGEYDYLIHGHTHVPEDEQIEETRVINPGAVGNNRWRPPSCAILDLSTGDLSWIEL